MTDKNLVSMGNKSFEDLKKVNEYGSEYWGAREIQPLLGYTQWRRFEDAIKRAITSCKQSGNTPENHFAGAGKMVELGSGSSREIPDYHPVQNSGDTTLNLRNERSIMMTLP